MTELWEVLLPPRPGYAGDYVGSVYVPFGSQLREASIAARERFGPSAVAVRRSGSDAWHCNICGSADLVLTDEYGLLCNGYCDEATS